MFRALLVLLVACFFQTYLCAQSAAVARLSTKLDSLEAVSGKKGDAYLLLSTELAIAQYKSEDIKAAEKTYVSIGKNFNLVDQPWESRTTAEASVQVLLGEVNIWRLQHLLDKERSTSLKDLITDMLAAKSSSVATKLVEGMLEQNAFDSHEFMKDWGQLNNAIFGSGDETIYLCDAWELMLTQVSEETDLYWGLVSGYSAYLKRTKAPRTLENRIALDTEKWKNWQRNGMLIDTSSAEDKDLFSIVEKMPMFPYVKKGSEEDDKKAARAAAIELTYFVNRNVYYPNEAKLKGVGGLVVISFVVLQNGVLDDIKVLRAPIPCLGEEVARVAQTLNELPLRFKAGEQRGKKVKVKYTLPVRFRLE
jgi:TonB family protein